MPIVREEWPKEPPPSDSTWAVVLLVIVVIIAVIAFVVWGVRLHHNAAPVTHTSAFRATIPPGVPSSIRARYADVLCQDNRKTVRQMEDFTGDSFEVRLLPGCFSGWVMMPRAWKSWKCAWVTGVPQDWIAYRFVGQTHADGPYIWGTNYRFGHAPPYFRLEGEGVVRFEDAK